ncbi:MAG: DNA-directed RNA polymerase subunit beta', partial [Candidatus Cloacimonetes bacterium]|nr:DNA-directed RNA polymerase subunit beta' [Candidatus Cloacimonadota bacterium]
MIRELKRDKVVKDYDAVSIKISSPEKIRDWSYGEVTRPDTINYRTLKPEKGGLFCERIFGPERDYECSCGKYKKYRFKGLICDRCGVEVTTSKVRRQRMGHIELAVPVAHIWFVKSIPSPIQLLLDLKSSELERVLYYESYIVLNPGSSDYNIGDVIDEVAYIEAKERYPTGFIAGMGAEPIRKLLEQMNLNDEVDKFRTAIKFETKQKKIQLIKKLKIVDAFLNSGNKPEWMILEVLPVMPPDLRPLVYLEGGSFATADFNDLYRRVITRNNRLKALMEGHAPEVILRNEKRILQEAIDALFDNSRKSRPVKGRGNRLLKSLSDQ